MSEVPRSPEPVPASRRFKVFSLIGEIKSRITAALSGNTTAVASTPKLTGASNAAAPEAIYAPEFPVTIANGEIGGFEQPLTYETAIGTVVVGSERGGRDGPDKGPNEDRALFVAKDVQNADGSAIMHHYLIVADGMGGMSAGEIISQFLCEELARDPSNPKAARDRALDRLRVQPWELAEAGSTLAMADLWRHPDGGYRMKSTHAGDSQVIVLRPDGSRRETERENIAAIFAGAHGNFDEKKYAESTRTGKLVNFIGIPVKDGNAAHITISDEFTIPSGSIVIACSDGVCGNLFAREMQEEILLENARRVAANEAPMTSAELHLFLRNLARENMQQQRFVQGPDKDNLSIALVKLP